MREDQRFKRDDLVIRITNSDQRGQKSQYIFPKISNIMLIQAFKSIWHDILYLTSRTIFKLMNNIYQSYHKFIIENDHPCIMAQSVFKTNASIRSGFNYDVSFPVPGYRIIKIGFDLCIAIDCNYPQHQEKDSFLHYFIHTRAQFWVIQNFYTGNKDMNIFKVDHINSKAIFTQ